MLLLRRPATNDNCGERECSSMIWGEVDRERRLKALLVAFALLILVIALGFAAISALS